MKEMTEGGNYFKDRESVNGPVMPFLFQQLLALKVHPGYDGDTQQDPAIFLDGLLKRLQENDAPWNMTYPPLPKGGVDPFTFENGRKYTCKCGNMDIIDVVKGKDDRIFEAFNTGESTTSLEACIKARCTKRRVDYRTCSKCGSNKLKVSPAIISKSAPSHFLVRVDRVTAKGAYMDNEVTFSTEEIDLSCLFAEKIKYKVYAVCEHDDDNGETMESGKYSALIKKGDAWFSIEDHKVKVVKNHIVGKDFTNGYLFFLEKVES